MLFKSETQKFAKMPEKAATIFSSNLAGFVVPFFSYKKIKAMASARPYSKGFLISKPTRPNWAYKGAPMFEGRRSVLLLVI